MQARRIDPRDSAWEREQRTYRVYFAEGHTQDEWEITDADVAQVLKWLSINARHRAFSLYATVADRDGVGQLRLMSRAAGEPVG